MKGILQGLGVTFSTFMRKTVTVEYRSEALAPEAAAQLPGLTWDFDHDEPFCTGCNVCVPTAGRCMTATMWTTEVRRRHQQPPQDCRKFGSITRLYALQHLRRSLSVRSDRDGHPGRATSTPFTTAATCTGHRRPARAAKTGRITSSSAQGRIDLIERERRARTAEETFIGAARRTARPSSIASEGLPAAIRNANGSSEDNRSRGWAAAAPLVAKKSRSSANRRSAPAHARRTRSQGIHRSREAVPRRSRTRSALFEHEARRGCPAGGGAAARRHGEVSGPCPWHDELPARRRRWPKGDRTGRKGPRPPHRAERKSGTYRGRRGNPRGCAQTLYESAAPRAPRPNLGDARGLRCGGAAATRGR